MLEDFLYELFPVVGVAVCISSAFILFVARRLPGAYIFIRFLAVADCLNGAAFVYAGFYGVIVTIYGETEIISPLRCLMRAFHDTIWTYADALSLLFLLFCALDRLLTLLISVQYKTVADFYLRWSMSIVLFALAFLVLIPFTYYPVLTSTNATILISAMCRYNEVVGEDFYWIHLQVRQWAPIIITVVLSFVVIIYVLRHTSQRWSYGWSEKKSDIKQLTFVCLVRAFGLAVSVHLPLLYLDASTSESLARVWDAVLRCSTALFVLIPQSAVYLIALPAFSNEVYIIFNKYSHNTERKWQSADDPPNEENGKQFEGTRAMFGSFYSMAGNVTGEAGIPIEITGQERSVSFYYDSPKK